METARSVLVGRRAMVVVREKRTGQPPRVKIRRKNIEPVEKLERRIVSQ
jgi:hypothetical protein